MSIFVFAITIITSPVFMSTFDNNAYASGLIYTCTINNPNCCADNVYCHSMYGYPPIENPFPDLNPYFNK